MAKSKSVLASLTTWKLFVALWSKGITRPEHTIFFTASYNRWTWGGLWKLVQSSKGLAIQLRRGRHSIILIYNIGAIGNEER